MNQTQATTRTRSAESAGQVKIRGPKRTDHKQDRDKTEGKMMANGTKVDHNKWDINDLNKETKTLSVEGGSKDGCPERGDDKW